MLGEKCSSCHVSWRHRVLTRHRSLSVAYHDAESGVTGGFGVFSGDELLDAEMPGVGAAEEGFGGGEEEAPVEHDVVAIRGLSIRFE